MRAGKDARPTRHLGNIANKPTADRFVKSYYVNGELYCIILLIIARL